MQWNSCIQSVGVIFLLQLLHFGNGLSCYRCLNLDCKNDIKVCKDVREFITEELRTFYYIEETLPPCPDPHDDLRWKIMQIASSPCNYQRVEFATCALTRFQVITETSKDSSFVTYGTVLGCGTVKLLTSIKNNIDNMNGNKCALNTRNVTLEKKLLSFYYELETCHVSTEYCTEDFCVAPLQSAVRPFKNQKIDRSFETGSIILIVALIVVFIVVIVLASVCRQPMNWVSNSYHVNSSSSNTNNTGSSSPVNFSRITTPNNEKYPPGLGVWAATLMGNGQRPHPPPSLRHVSPVPPPKPTGLLQEDDNFQQDIYRGRRTFSTFRDDHSSEC